MKNCLLALCWGQECQPLESVGCTRPAMIGIYTGVRMLETPPGCAILRHALRQVKTLLGRGRFFVKPSENGRSEFEAGISGPSIRPWRVDARCATVPPRSLFTMFFGKAKVSADCQWSVVSGQLSGRWHLEGERNSRSRLTVMIPRRSREPRGRRGAFPVILVA